MITRSKAGILKPKTFTIAKSFCDASEPLSLATTLYDPN